MLKQRRRKKFLELRRNWRSVWRRSEKTKPVKRQAWILRMCDLSRNWSGNSIEFLITRELLTA
jgi:hypothetical protein